MNYYKNWQIKKYCNPWSHRFYDAESFEVKNQFLPFMRCLTAPSTSFQLLLIKMYDQKYFCHPTCVKRNICLEKNRSFAACVVLYIAEASFCASNVKGMQILHAIFVCAVYMRTRYFYIQLHGFKYYFYFNIRVILYISNPNIPCYYEQFIETSIQNTNRICLWRIIASKIHLLFK